ncbi:transposase [Pelosinus fermentans]|uniref:transposase n=1 Tax=Pelosinus fermentans TaxID=365349 RepID=UPI0009E5B74E|nr:transposase [Pelosinus fermentans]
MPLCVLCASAVRFFEEEEDYKQFIETIQKYKWKSGYEIYAYCLMGNHVHLLMK